MTMSQCGKLQLEDITGQTEDFRFQGLYEGCPIHPTRVDLSLVFAIRLTGSRFARDLENIASRAYTGWVENVVDSIRFDVDFR